MIQQVIILLVGFIFLVKGADWFVEGAASIARKLGIPQLIIGLTIALYDQNGNVLSSVNHHSATFSNLSHGRSYSIKFLESNGSASVEKTIHFTVS